MKILVVYKVDINEPTSSGVIKKMYDQYNALITLKHDVILAYIQGDKIVIGNTFIKHQSIYRRYFIKNFLFFKVLSEQLTNKKFDIIYVRHPYSSPYFIKWLSNISKSNPESKIVLEVPTFPFHKEFRGLQKLSLMIDGWFSRYLKKYIHLIVVMGQTDALWGISTLNLSNGIEINLSEEFKSQRKKGIVRLLAIGNWHYWHGLDRLIKGLSQFYSKNPDVIITLDIVGNGKTLNSYIKQVVQMQLDEYVKFHGYVPNKNLIGFYKSADICVGTLGNHRLGLTENCPLKHREYCSHGLPFILSSFDPDFPNDLSFVQYHPPNDEPLDCELILEFYAKTSMKNSLIRDYTKKNLTWEAKMQSIIDHLESL